MFRLKTEQNIKNIPKLEINIPSFGNSLEKSPRQFNKPLKSKSAANQHYLTKTISPIKIKNYKEPHKNNIVYHSKIANEQNLNYSKMLKNKVDLKTSKHYSNSPRNNKDLLYPRPTKEISNTNLNTARNID